MMTNPSGSNVLIVGDAPGAGRLRDRLVASGANVEVVSVVQGSRVARQKRIDTAFIAATLDDDTRQLCSELAALGVTQVFLPKNGVEERDIPLGGIAYRRLKATAA
jgi:hypothetical protein